MLRERWDRNQSKHLTNQGNGKGTANIETPIGAAANQEWQLTRLDN
ncbi:MAG: hypothetical protein ACAF41_31270 [Leptolyngbya sp. BL-A-14]